MYDWKPIGYRKDTPVHQHTCCGQTFDCGRKVRCDCPKCGQKLTPPKTGMNRG